MNQREMDGKNGTKVNKRVLVCDRVVCRALMDGDRLTGKPAKVDIRDIGFSGKLSVVMNI